MISSARRSVVVGALDLAGAHRDRGLAQEAPGAVVEHHHELLRGRREHSTLSVGLR